MAPLDGIRVVTVEHAVAGPLCTRHLADLGAKVTKIEPIERGDFARHYDSSVSGWSSHFVWLNQEKLSVAVDLGQERGRGILQRMLLAADVFVANVAPSKADDYVSWPEIREANPGLIECVISGYGSSGSYAMRKAFDLLIQGEAGVTRATGTPEQPAKVGISVADLAGGVYAFASILGALHERHRTGRGRRLNISLFEIMADWMTPLLLMEKYGGGAPPPSGLNHASIVPYGAFKTKSGDMINIAIQTREQWRRFCVNVISRPELAADPRYSTNERRQEARIALEGVIGAALSEVSSEELKGRLEEYDIPWGEIRSVREVLDHPELSDSRRWITATLGQEGPATRILDSPLAAAGAPGPRRVPALGADTIGVLRELGYSAGHINELSDDGIIWVDSNQD